MKSPTLILLAAAAMCHTGCRTVDRILDEQPSFKAADPAAVVPREFLYTKYEPLNRWMDQAVRVQIMDMSLLSVFEHPCLRGFHYKFLRRPPRAHVINMDKLAMTRRQILWALSHDYQLRFSPKYGMDGEVLYIEISSREELLEAQAN